MLTPAALLRSGLSRFELSCAISTFLGFAFDAMIDTFRRNKNKSNRILGTIVFSIVFLAAYWAGVLVWHFVSYSSPTYQLVELLRKAVAAPVFWISSLLFWICGTALFEWNQARIKDTLPGVAFWSITSLSYSALGAFGVVLIYWLFASIWWITSVFVPGFKVRLFDVTVGLAVVTMGGLAYWLKRLNQTWYGIVEVAFAWFSAVSVSTRLGSGHRDLATWLGLVGAAYIVTRGYDNIIQGSKRAEKSLSHVKI